MGVLHNAGDGKGRTVRLRLKQALQDDLVELRVRAAGKEAVELVKLNIRQGVEWESDEECGEGEGEGERVRRR